MLVIYLVAVAIAGLFGYALGIVVGPNVLNGEAGALGPVTFSLTPLNLALYGVVMVAVTLGVFLLAVSVVARYDDAAVEP